MIEAPKKPVVRIVSEFGNDETTLSNYEIVILGMVVLCMVFGSIFAIFELVTGLIRSL